MPTLRHFKASEFARCKPACSISDMNEGFLYLLDEAREIAGVPFKLNSCFRSVEYEHNHARLGTSSHCKGIAADISCKGNLERLKIVTALIQVGFTRIGIGKTFIHVDYDKKKNPSIWLY